jgi:hypothetical protein
MVVGMGMVVPLATIQSSMIYLRAFGTEGFPLSLDVLHFDMLVLINAVCFGEIY